MKGHLLKVVATAMLWMLCHAAHAGTVTYVYTDPQGTPLAEADASGNITARFDYAPYGTAVASMNPAPNGPGYTGHVNDPDTGLVYMQARYYDPAVGRFLSIDPVTPATGNAFNFNRYDYANNNPIVNTDPDGRETGIAFHAEWAADGGHVVPTSPDDKVATPLMYAMGGLAAVTVGAEVVGVVKTAIRIDKALSDSTKESTITRYMGPGEAQAAAQNGEIPNVGVDGIPRPTHVTTDTPVSSAATAQTKYELPTPPTHSATVPANRVSDLGPTPDGRSLTSGGGSQSATNQPIRVKPDEIKPLTN